MMDPIGLLLLALGLATGGGGGGASPAPAPGGIKLPSGTPAWPQALPSGLPPFPGKGWEYDEPPPAAVQERAKQLVTQLWAKGQGASKTEQTAGRWITYRAELVRSGNKGVVAYRLKAPAAPPRLPRVTPAQPESRAPKKKKTTSPRVAKAPKVTTSPGLPTGSTAAVPAAKLPTVEIEVGPGKISAVQLPELKRGDGIKPKPPDAHVAFLQQKLTEKGIPLVADGQFGKDTQTAVIAFQVQHGLAPAEPVETLRARGFGAVKLATWTALLEARA